jgi:hypothetical protein
MTWVRIRTPFGRGLPAERFPRAGRAGRYLADDQTVAPCVSDWFVRGDLFVAGRVECAAGICNAGDDRGLRHLHADDVGILESGRRVSAGVFSTEVRACGVGLAIACSRLGSAVGTFLLPLGIVHLGFHATMMVLAAVLLIGMIVSIAWAPETKHLTLNEASGA